MPAAAWLTLIACALAAFAGLYVLARHAWVRTTRATLLALALLLAFTYWEASRAEGMRALGLIASATLTILPAFVGGLAGVILGQRRRRKEQDDQN